MISISRTTVIAACLTLYFLDLSGSRAATSRNPLTALVSTISSDVKTDAAMETMHTVYSTDHWFTFPKFEETASYLKKRLEQDGLSQVEISGGRADGITQVGYWTMPLAWDASSARLEMREPEHELLCNYAAVPSSLGMWSGSTPKGGIDAEVVDIRKTPWTEVKGKLVLTDKNSAGYKDKLVQYGALGAINGYSENPKLVNDRQWVNAWGDNGWGFTKASTPLLSFSVTPKQTDHLRALIAQGKRVMVHANVQTRYYAGRYPYVTAVLPGKTTEEVLVLGHTSEQGAQDNATGVSAMVEAVHTISTLIHRGKLPQPQRTIRILLMPEMYGSLSYITAHQDRMKRTVAAMTVDTPAASYDLPGTEYTFYLNPQVAMSYTDALIEKIAAAYFGQRRPWHWSEMEPGTDSYLGEPTVGVPDVWSYSGTGVVTHHNSADTPDTVDPRSLHDLISVIASYLYFNAKASEADIPWLSEITIDHVHEEMDASVSKGIEAAHNGDAIFASYEIERVRYFEDRGRHALEGILRLVPEGHHHIASQTQKRYFSELSTLTEAEIGKLKAAGVVEKPVSHNRDAQQIVVQRKRIGTIPLDDLPHKEWSQYPSGAWNKLIITALYWCDGKRNLDEVIHLTQMEMGPTRFDFVGYFRFLQQHGYVDFKNAASAIRH
ncbi:MAG TPA: DUF4910 domain-containing protein [Bryobacteraceae bacterium]|nr:DUF4910 domain-containing protein [Bryobacteraceae bacterium]